MPMRWVQVFGEMSFVDEAICVLIPLAGIGLMMQRKRSWALAIAGLFFAFCQNVYCIATGAELIYPIAFPILGNSLVFVVLYFFRYPYLDRRDSILSGYTRRYPVTIPIRFENVDVVVKSISAFGCSIEFNGKMKMPAVHSNIKFTMHGIEFEGHVRYHHDKHIGVRFENPKRLSRSKLREFVNASGSVRKAS
jgi:hypothetical protein